MKKIFTSIIIFFSAVSISRAQDTVKQERYSFHFQQTIIPQFKPGFNADYTGQNSLLPNPETQTSITSTFFGAARLWKGATGYFNPELSGGSGLSRTLGVAGFPNGETFRVSSVDPRLYIARLYLMQTFEWGHDKDTIEGDKNVLAGLKSKRYFSLAAGKFSMTDFFDGNSFSHDPRGQFMNWSLMDNGAWDYRQIHVVTFWALIQNWDNPPGHFVLHLRW